MHCGNHTPTTQCILLCRHCVLHKVRLHICYFFSVLRASYEAHLFNVPMGAAAPTHISSPCLLQTPTTLLFVSRRKWIHLHGAPEGKNTTLYSRCIPTDTQYTGYTPVCLLLHVKIQTRPFLRKEENSTS